MKKRILSILVDNTSGVLSRVAGLFSRRGYNIDSLTVGETQNPAYSRMTVVVRGDDQVLDAFVKLLNGYEIKEMVRTGITGLSRGARDMFDEFDVDFDS